MKPLLDKSHYISRKGKLLILYLLQFFFTWFKCGICSNQEVNDLSTSTNCQSFHSSSATKSSRYKKHETQTALITILMAFKTSRLFAAYTLNLIFVHALELVLMVKRPCEQRIAVMSRNIFASRAVHDRY